MDLPKCLKASTSVVDQLTRYYDQICSIEPKFPFSENQICLTFTWKDAFDKGSLFGGSVKLALASLGYEKSCVLFNCAALASQIAAEQNLDNDEGLKTAAKQYQEVFPTLAAKQCIMQANAEYHQSILAKQQKKFGEEIARLQHAAELIKNVASRYDEYVNVKDFSDKISRALTAAKKDNDFIYHDRVPDLKDLDPIGKATLVKPTPVNVPISQKFSDLFEKMVPVSVQQSLAVFGQRKADLVNRSIAQMREATTLANGVLASLNLPAAIEDVSGDTVPQSILTKSTSVVEQGGIQTVDQLIKELPELLQRNREILEESLRLLDEEEATDNDLRSKFKERWQRTASNDLYKPLRAEGSKFRAVLDKAVQADGNVKERYQSHRDTIALLCKPEPELNAAIPSANPAKTMQGSEVVNVLKSLLSSLDELKKEREGLENDLKSVNFDMTSKFLTALAQDGVINEEALSVTELDRIYGGLTAKVQESLKKQEELLKNIQFYNELTEILVRFQNKCSDIVFARKTERDELLKVIGILIRDERVKEQKPKPAKPQPPARPPPPVLPANRVTPAAAAPTGAGVASPAPTQTPGSAPPPQAQGPPYPTYPGYPGYCQMPMPMGYNPYAYGQYNMPYTPVYHQSPGQAPYPGPQQPAYPFPQPPQQSYYPQQ
ncbi:programmed cell death 6-interacting protein [Cricetulus griseus]|nr:programmed cell death 6-interacting protein [Cricetulus griseus]